MWRQVEAAAAFDSEVKDLFLCRNSEAQRV